MEVMAIARKRQSARSGDVQRKGASYYYPSGRPKESEQQAVQRLLDLGYAAVGLVDRKGVNSWVRRVRALA